MMFKKGFFVFLFVFGHAAVSAQKMELGRVTVSELEEKVYPKDSSVAAAILLNKGKSYFEYDPATGFTIVTEVETKIKIYKKEGYEWANKEVVFYNASGKPESVSFRKAVTYNLINGKIEKSKLRSDGEFTEVVNKFWAVQKIAMPDVKEGSIIEYAYTIKSPYLTNLPEWGFQKTIPVNYSEYQTNIPDYFKYNTHFKGNLTPVITKNGIEKVYKGVETTKTNAPGGFITEKNDYAITYMENMNNYKLENIKPLKDEKYINNINNYTASLVHELARIQYPQTAVKIFASDWESVVKTIYEDPDFGDELKKVSYFEEDVKALTNGLVTRDDKIMAVFNFVKTKLNWNKMNGFSCTDGVKKAYQTKTGNVAEINLMLIAMLRYLGVEANPVLVSTRSNGIAIFPSRTAFNYVIAAIEIDNEIILLDATDKFSLPDILPVRDLNWFGRIIKRDGTSEVVDLMPKISSMNIISMMASIDAEGKVSGKIKNQYADYNAYSFRKEHGALSQESQLSRLEEKYDGITVSDYQLTNLSELLKPVVESYSFSHANMVEIIGDRMYLSPMLFLIESDNPFKQDERQYPIDFGYPFANRYNINLNIPEGYQIETLPAGANIALDENLGNFKYTISPNGKQVQLLVVNEMNQPIVSPQHYSSLKAFYKEMLAKQTEKIVLKKV